MSRLTPVRWRQLERVFLRDGFEFARQVGSHRHYIGDREHPFYLTATLRIRNADPKRSISILSVDYYNSQGKLLTRYLEKPVRVGPLATTRYVIKESDKSGGSGANFIVKWKASEMVNAPIIESIMIGTKTRQGISFISRGRAIKD